MKKILFNDKYGQTKDVLEERKTQTRMIVKLNKEHIENFQVDYFNNTFDFLDGIDLIDVYYANHYEKLPFKINEIVAVAECYKDLFYAFDKCRNPLLNISVTNATDTAGWSNKMFVKPELMPHRICITNVRIERLQDISDEDCLAEGVVISEPKIKGGVRMYYPCEYLKECANRVGWGRVYNTPREAYAVLIDELKGKGTWERNPYVFVYDFKLIK